MLDRDVMTVLEVTAFDGVMNGGIPGIAVLVALDLAFGAVAVVLLSRASSSDVK